MKKELKDYVTTIPDFPQKGIMFRDITSVIDDADGLQLAINSMQDLVKDIDFDVVVGAESRGFVFGTPIAYNLHKPMVLIRKKGKLPRETVEVSYDLEYGQATQLVEKLGGEVVGVLVLMELKGLKGRDALAPVPVFSAISYEGN